jgi:glycosyltransferase involved in cell wall biosynthesis
VDVIPFHHALDLFVQSSAYEGTPNVVLEAMAMETPVVATRAGGTEELAQDAVHGLIIDPGDVSQLVRAITQVLDDPAAARQRVIAAHQRVEGELSFDRRLDRINAVYAEIMQEPG